MDHIINIQARTQRGKALNKFRKAGQVPANIFSKDEPSDAIWVNSKELLQMMVQAHEGSLIYLQGASAKERTPAILRKATSNIRSKTYLHVEFQKVNLNEAVTVEVSIEITGEAPALKSGYVLENPYSAIEITALPTAIPESIVVDVSELTNLDDRITVADLKLPKNVQVLTEADTTIVAVVEPMQQAAEEAADEATQVAATQEATNDSETAEE